MIPFGVPVEPLVYGITAGDAECGLMGTKALQIDGIVET